MNKLISKLMSPEPTTIQRWASSGKGRSSCVSYSGMVWAVATAIDDTADLASQVDQSLALLDMLLSDAGSSRHHLLSVQVILTHASDRDAFDAIWQTWIGPNPAHWPQRSCVQSALAPGMLVELVVTAAPGSAQILQIS
jgi:enamine deaminase RidA (YjgF/YER057c/UK114 family)